MTAAQILKLARGHRGVSQRDLAGASGVAQPRIAAIESGQHDPGFSRIEELLAPLGQRLVPVPTSGVAVWEAALAISAALDANNRNLAWRHVIQASDSLAAAEPATRVALCITPPALTPDPKFDALIAAIADYWLAPHRLPLPRWVREPERILEEPWDVEPLAKLQSLARRATPRVIARHGVYLAESELLSV